MPISEHGRAFVLRRIASVATMEDAEKLKGNLSVSVLADEEVKHAMLKRMQAVARRVTQ